MDNTATLTIEKLGHQGDGLAPWKEVDGRAIRASVPFALPGEDVRASLHETGAHAHGTLLEILKTSPVRQAPACQHFGACGGCRLQHAPADMVVALKNDQVERALEYNGISFTPRAHFTTPLHSRRRVSLEARKENGRVQLGFLRRESHAIVPITMCPVLRPELEKLIAPLQDALAPLLQKEKVEVQLTVLHGAIEFCLSGLVLSSKGEAALVAFGTAHNLARLAVRKGEKEVWDILLNAAPMHACYGAYRVPLPPAAFMQASDEAEREMLDFLSPHMEEAKNFADLFCGTGLFTLSFLKDGRAALAADVDGPALEALQKATPRPQALKALRANLMREPVPAKELKDYPIIILDPPRAGAREQCLEIAKAGAAKVLYISCNPQSFARDARILYDGGYRLQNIKVFDQFLYSHHTEVIGVFVR